MFYLDYVRPFVFKCINRCLFLVQCLKKKNNCNYRTYNLEKTVQ